MKIAVVGTGYVGLVTGAGLAWAAGAFAGEVAFSLIAAPLLPRVADEIARAAVYLASDEASFITGSTLSANGGQFFA